MTHINLGNTSSEETISYEIEGAQRLIEEKLGAKPDVFVFPYSSYNALSAEIALRSHLATRNAGPFVAGYGYRVLPVDSGSTTAAVNAALADAITAGAWFVTAGHGMDGNGFQPVTSQLLSEHLAFVAERQSQVWVDTFRNVALYRIARERLNVRIAAISARAAALWLDGMLDAPLGAIPLTVELPFLRIPGAIRVRDALGRELPFVVANGVLRMELRQGEEVLVEIED